MKNLDQGPARRLCFMHEISAPPRHIKGSSLTTENTFILIWKLCCKLCSSPVFPNGLSANTSLVGDAAVQNQVSAKSSALWRVFAAFMGYKVHCFSGLLRVCSLSCAFLLSYKHECSTSLCCTQLQVWPVVWLRAVTERYATVPKAIRRGPAGRFQCSHGSVSEVIGEQVAYINCLPLCPLN